MPPKLNNISPTTNNIFTILIIFIILGCVAIHIILSNKKRNKYLYEIEKHCKQKGFTFLQDASYIPRCSEIFYNLSCFREKTYYYSNIMIGKSEGIDFRVLDFYYCTGKNGSTPHYYTICVLSKNELHFPEFCIRNKNSKYYNAYNYGKILPINENFAKFYTMQAKDLEESKKYFSPELILELVNKSNYDYETKEDYLLVLIKDQKNMEERMKMLADSIDIYKTLENQLSISNS